ncbi:methyl-accepting chemotaxis protein [Pseudaeromonas paramecii]|uniref:Methyl-accepting chemotaxis protein n=1 Tax=Pseudaeromonas paramecii TaxID=2138166 RepID=A0ABP8QD40_9GAMM
MPTFRSLRTQLLTLLGVSLLLLLLVALLGQHFLSRELTAYQRLLQGPMAAAALVDEANLQFKIQVQEWKNVLLRGKDPANLQKYWSQFEEQEAKVDDKLQALATLAAELQDTALSQAIASLRQEHQTLGQAYRHGKAAFEAAGADPYAGDKAVKGIDRAASEQMSQLVDKLHQQAMHLSQQSQQSADTMVRVGLSLLLLAAVAIVLVSLWLLSRQVVAPLQRLTHYLTRLSQGEILSPLQLHRQDELGQLTSAANRLRGFLQETLDHLQQSHDELEQSSLTLGSISSQLTGGTQDQLSRTDMVATAMHEMTATAQNVADNAAQAADAADRADQASREGDGMMQQTIATISQMSQEIDQSADVIRRLSEESRRIITVLEVIQTIAEQTNLLALNAAIEAARAGEQGRGFAVVADEVRTLARRTADSTAEINKIIEQILGSTQDAVQAISSSQQLGSQGVERVTQAGQMLRRIGEAISDIHGMNQQIATAAEQQTAAVEDISHNLVDIKTVATEIQQQALRTQQASGQLHQNSQRLTTVVERFRQ